MTVLTPAILACQTPITEDGFLPPRTYSETGMNGGPQGRQTGAIMSPSNEHELAIARIVDKIDTNGRLDPGAMDEIVGTMAFTPSEDEKSFLVDYVRWRMTRPVAK